MQNIVIREACLEDVKDIYQLQYDAFGKSAWKLEIIQEDLADKQKVYFVSTCEGKIRGFASFLVGIGDSDLLQLVVDTKYRKRGVARNLLLYAFSCLKKRNVHKIFLEVRTSNSATLFYEKMGFLSLSVRKQYYGDEDAIIYMKMI